MSLAYLTALLISIIGLGLLDYRHKLALFCKPVRAVVVISAATTGYLIWDLIGISNGVFFRGENNLMTGILLSDELPLEELFFLVLLSYNILLVYLFAARRFAR